MSYKTPKSYLPHSGAMVLIDEIIEVGADFIITKSIVKNHGEFCESLTSSLRGSEADEAILPFSSLRGSLSDSENNEAIHESNLDCHDFANADSRNDKLNANSGDSNANLALPTYKSIELMAQSLGIFRALNEKGSGSKLGFLLGARRFKILRPFIMNEARIKVAVSMQDSSGMGVYDCEVFENDALIATASISALNPSADFLSHIKGAQK